MDWQPIETAPKDGGPFIVLNCDREVWVAKRDKHGRMLFRTNQRHEPRKYEIVQVDGEELLREDKAYNEEHECWMSNWTVWARLYEFAPTHWMPLPDPPKD